MFICSCRRFDTVERHNTSVVWGLGRPRERLPAGASPPTPLAKRPPRQERAYRWGKENCDWAFIGAGFVYRKVPCFSYQQMSGQTLHRRDGSINYMEKKSSPAVYRRLHRLWFVISQGGARAGTICWEWHAAPAVQRLRGRGAWAGAEDEGTQLCWRRFATGLSRRVWILTSEVTEHAIR